MLKTIYIKGLMIEHSITQRTCIKHINQYTTVVNNSKTKSFKFKAYHDFIADVVF